jgi:hypothetical protein
LLLLFLVFCFLFFKIYIYIYINNNEYINNKINWLRWKKKEKNYIKIKKFFNKKKNFF